MEDDAQSGKQWAEPISCIGCLGVLVIGAAGVVFALGSVLLIIKEVLAWTTL